MVLVGDGRPEQSHDAVAHHLVDGPFVAMDGLHHPLEDRIEELACLLGIAIGQELHRALEVCKQDGHLLALPFQRASGGEDLLGEVLRRVDPWGMELRLRQGAGREEGPAASPTELLTPLVLKTARRARRGE
jgi:hypothetical protein